MIYDFILFESSRIINHYKDIEIIAHMLMSAGKTVAIADVCYEEELCKDKTIPHIKVNAKNPNINDKYPEGWLSNKLYIINKINLWNQYLIEVFRDLEGKCNNMYIGSYDLSMSVLWLNKLSPNCNYFIWGLRSFYLNYYKLAPFSYKGIRSYFVSRYFKSHDNVFFFVSDEFVKTDYIKQGIDAERLVIRPERVSKELVFRDLKKSTLDFLTIGSLRPDKRVEISIEAIQGVDNVKYVVAGSSDSEQYENLIKNAIKSNNIERRNYRLSETEYNDLFDNADFLILNDKKAASSVTNGTLLEALLHGVPIIAPNYNPYKDIVKTYGVGILFEENNLLSIQNAIREAVIKGKIYFKDNLISYQKEHMWTDVIMRFKKDIRNLLNNRLKE